MAEYLVRTDIYNGPMDLLLFLIRRDEVDIYDIPIARILRQYLEYVEMLKNIDPNVAGEFLVMAALLMEIKSRMLLPRQTSDEGTEEAEDISDPRLELVRQLLEYKKYKDASFELGAAAQLQTQKWPRSPAPIKPPPMGEVDLDEVQIWDLVAAFNKMMASIGMGPTTHDVVFDDTPISLHAVDILDRLQREGGEMAFADIFRGRTKSEMIGLFLALLELMRQQRVRVAQEVSFGRILIVLISAEPIHVGEEAWGENTAGLLGGAEIATGEERVANEKTGALADDEPDENLDGSDEEPFEDEEGEFANIAVDISDGEPKSAPRHEKGEDEEADEHRTE